MGTGLQCFFFLPILWCSQAGDHLQEDLAKFGHRPDMKIKKFKESFVYFGYLLELVGKIWWFRIYIFGNLANYDFFFSQKILCMCSNYIFQVKKKQKFALKQNSASVIPWWISHSFSPPLLWEIYLCFH